MEKENFESVNCKKIKIILGDKNDKLTPYELTLQNAISVSHHLLYLDLPEHTKVFVSNSSSSKVVYEKQETDILSDIKVLHRFTDRQKQRWLELSFNGYVHLYGPSGDRYENLNYKGWIKEVELRTVPFIW
jgi:hypothetical protein